MVFCNNDIDNQIMSESGVTILILIDGFLQWFINKYNKNLIGGHNPYFNRWFSAIANTDIINLHLKLSQSLF